MTTLLDDVARAIYAAGCLEPPPRKKPTDIMLPEARAALQTVARWLREPENMPEELRDELTLTLARSLGAYRVCRALASHLEKEMGSP